MAIPFPDLDPYETLSVTKDSTPEEIKKSYRKLCLKYHPDKLSNLEDDIKEEFKLKFEKIQFSHSILSDDKKKKRYDTTGSLEEIGDDSFDWFEYFKDTKVEITEESIKKDKELYQGSDDEIEDIVESWIDEGKFLRLFESIPHTEITKSEEERLFKIVGDLIKDGIIEGNDDWDKYKLKRKTLFNKFLKKQLKEEKEAEELKKLINKKNNAKEGESLKSIIQKKRSRDMDALIANLESRHGQKKKKGKSKHEEIDDAEFEKLQKKLFSK